jgi:hypothetical protein
MMSTLVVHLVPADWKKHGYVASVLLAKTYADFCIVCLEEEILTMCVGWKLYTAQV